MVAGMSWAYDVWKRRPRHPSLVCAVRCCHLLLTCCMYSNTPLKHVTPYCIVCLNVEKRKEGKIKKIITDENRETHD
jgi:hypothetical protein